MTCPFCLSNGKMEILRETEEVYLVQVIDADRNLLPGRYLVIPKEHVEEIENLPAGFMKDITKLVAFIPEIKGGAAYNISMNVGEEAGQRVARLHW